MDEIALDGDENFNSKNSLTPSGAVGIGSSFFLSVDFVKIVMMMTVKSLFSFELNERKKFTVQLFTRIAFL
jgi:hypothetical protein